MGSMDAIKPYAAVDGGIRLAVRVIPRASRNKIDGIVQDAEGRPALKLRLAAPPVEGAANTALIAFLAAALGLRKADITIRSGETGRTKLLRLTGDSAALLRKMDAWLG
jgi:uncharacterized protein (TIGR00251 family)